MYSNSMNGWKRGCDGLAGRWEGWKAKRCGGDNVIEVEVGIM